MRMDAGKVALVLRILLDRDDLDVATLCRFCMQYPVFDEFLEKVLDWQRDVFSICAFDVSTGRKWHSQVVKKLVAEGCFDLAASHLDDNCDAEAYNLTIKGLSWTRNFSKRNLLARIVERMKCLGYQRKGHVFHKTISYAYPDAYSPFLEMMEECPNEAAPKECYERVLKLCWDLDAVLVVIKEAKAKSVELDVVDTLTRFLDYKPDKDKLPKVVRVITETAEDPDAVVACLMKRLPGKVMYQVFDAVAGALGGAFPKTCAPMFASFLKYDYELWELPNVMMSIFLLVDIDKETCKAIVRVLEYQEMMNEATVIRNKFPQHFL